MKPLSLVIVVVLALPSVALAQSTDTSIGYDQPAAADNNFVGECQPGASPQDCRELQVLDSSDANSVAITRPTFGSIPVTPTMTARSVEPATTPPPARWCKVCAGADNIAGVRVWAQSGDFMLITPGTCRNFPARWIGWPTPGAKVCSYLTIQSDCYADSTCGSASGDTWEVVAY